MLSLFETLNSVLGLFFVVDVVVVFAFSVCFISCLCCLPKPNDHLAMHFYLLFYTGSSLQLLSSLAHSQHSISIC